MKNKTPKVKKHVRHFVRIANQHIFCADRFSGYYARISMADKGKIKYDEVYGPEQCRQHIEELRKHVYDGKKPYADATFEIVREVTTETVIATDK